MQNEPAEKTRRIWSYFNAVLKLSLPKQASCVFIAAVECLPVWRHHCQTTQAYDTSEMLIDCFLRWLGNEVPANSLKAISDHFRGTLPHYADPSVEHASKRAGQVIFGIAEVALGLAGELHAELIEGTLLNAAAVACDITREAAGFECDYSILTDCELQFIAGWWSHCCELFPELQQLRTQ